MSVVLRGIGRVRLLDLYNERDHLVVRVETAVDTMRTSTLAYAYAYAGALQNLVKQHDILLPTAAKTKQRAQGLAAILAERSPGIIGLRLKEHDLHLHFPAGAVPKDGPSAGVAVTTALVSLFTGRPARADIAMTGEITLRGQILPVGGIREKVLAAHRAGIRAVILPDRNRKDEPDIPTAARAMRLHFVRHIREVLALVLLPLPDEQAAAE